MSLDKTLKSKGALQRHRNVLTRPERIEKLKEEGRWTEDSTAIFSAQACATASVAGCSASRCAEQL